MKKRFENPLDKIRIASPCAANWDEMRGDERKRFCGQCSLNVYNLSEMTRTEAENFLINSEGRVCLRIYRRRDGSVIAADCPVGWQRVKRKFSRAATASFALILTFLSGVLSLKIFVSLDKAAQSFIKSGETEEKSGGKISFGGITGNLAEIKSEILRSRNR